MSQQSEVEAAPPKSTPLSDLKPNDNGQLSHIQLDAPILHLDTSLARAAVSDPLQTYLRVVASNSTNICNQARHVIYHSAGDEALHGSSTSTLVSIENVQLMSWNNPSQATATYTQSYTIGFTTSTSTEVSASIGLAPSFEGVSVWNASAGYKTITTAETQTSTTRTVEVSIPPQSSVYFYQRRYHFLTDVYFTLDAWRELSIAGSNGGYHIQRAAVLSFIDATEYLTASKPLSGTTTAEFDTQVRAGWHGQHVRKFENLTQRAKNTLKGMGIDGSQRG
ncbi:hypothetical protein FPV67DRAFT_1672177 [Lyophyllum atratum]|nr:hypothetical protein FPV67DRAFT_1672177 [Lyophyllum atratum]